MQFTVPQFIERETRIVGPLTFKQFIYIGVAGAISVFLHFTLKSLFLSSFLTLLLMGTASGLAFLKPRGFPLPVLIQNLFVYSLRPKIYLWRKKTSLVIISQPKIKPEKEAEEKSSLKITERSRLRELFTYLETKTK